jgi:hypothetical protein
MKVWCTYFHYWTKYKLSSIWGPSWSWSYGSDIYNYLCNQCLSPLTLWGRTPLRPGVLDTTLCDKVCQCLVTSRWFSPGISVSSTNKTDRHDIAEILLKVALNTTNQPNYYQYVRVFFLFFILLSYCYYAISISFQMIIFCHNRYQWYINSKIKIHK